MGKHLVEKQNNVGKLPATQIMTVTKSSFFIAAAATQTRIAKGAAAVVIFHMTNQNVACTKTVTEKLRS